MQKKPNRLLVILPLLLSGLINYQAYAAEPAKSPASANQQPAAAASSEPNKAASERTASKNTAAAPVSPEAAKAKHQPQAAATKAETTAVGPVELQSLSIVEALLSGLLTAVFVLVLVRGNLFKHH